MIDVGDYSRDNDSRLFNKSNMGKAFFSKALNISEYQNISKTNKTNIRMPVHFVADETFP